MALKYTINPAYKYLEPNILSIVSNFDQGGKSIFKARNEIKVFKENDILINVKSYKIPIFINQIIYSLFRPTKASRAYHYAFELIKRGFMTPEPIAYFEQYECGLLKHSYFISLHTPLDGNMRIFNDDDTTNEGKHDLVKAFAQYTAQLHEKEVLHIDYSPGNILYKKNDDGSYLFSLIDINRMKFCHVDIETGCANFSRMCGNDDFFREIATFYAESRGFNKEKCIELCLKDKSEDRIKRAKKAKFKENIKRI